MNNYKIAVIPGDGIGKEVIPEGIKILKEISKQHQFKLTFDEFDFASCDYYEKNGKMAFHSDELKMIFMDCEVCICSLYLIPTSLFMYTF